MSLPPPPPTAPDGAGVEPEEGIRWGLGDAALGWLLGILVTTFATLAAVVGTGNLDRADAWADELSIAWFALLQAPLEVVLLGWPLLVTWRKGHGAVIDLRLRAELRDVPLGLAAGVATQLILLPLLYVPLLWLLGDRDVSAAAREVTERAQGSTGGALLLIVVVVLVAPLAEEVFYRGLVLRSLERRFGSTVAVWGSALLFGAAHLQPLQLLGQAAFGLVAALLVRRFGRLGPAVWAHVGFNATAVIGLLWVS